MARIFLSCVQQPATRLIDLGRAQHVQSFVRALVVEDFDEVVEAGLLLKKVAGGLRCMRSWRRFEVESPVELLARRIDVLYENLLFQNLIPAFDEVPMRRVFPVCFYTQESWTDQKFWQALQEVIRAAGLELVREYPFIQGSGLYRASLQKSNRETRSQFEDANRQLVEHLVQTLKKSNIPIIANVTVNVSPSAESKREPSNWAGKMKDLTEAVKNLLLISASAAFLFDGTLMKSGRAEANKPCEISITKLDRKAELHVLPKILEATKPEEFRETIDSLQMAQPQRPRTGRKFR
jgi:hypothetical protein